MIFTKIFLLELPFHTYTDQFPFRCRSETTFFQDFLLIGSRDIPASDVFLAKIIDL